MPLKKDLSKSFHWRDLEKISEATFPNLIFRGMKLSTFSSSEQYQVLITLYGNIKIKIKIKIIVIIIIIIIIIIIKIT